MVDNKSNGSAISNSNASQGSGGKMKFQASLGSLITPRS